MARGQHTGRGEPGRGRHRRAAAQPAPRTPDRDEDRPPAHQHRWPPPHDPSPQWPSHDTPDEWPHPHRAATLHEATPERGPRGAPRQAGHQGPGERRARTPRPTPPPDEWPPPGYWFDEWPTSHPTTRDVPGQIPRRDHDERRARESHGAPPSQRRRPRTTPREASPDQEHGDWPPASSETYEAFPSQRPSDTEPPFRETPQPTSPQEHPDWPPDQDIPHGTAPDHEHRDRPPGQATTYGPPEAIPDPRHSAWPLDTAPTHGAHQPTPDQERTDWSPDPAATCETHGTPPSQGHSHWPPDQAIPHEAAPDHEHRNWPPGQATAYEVHEAIPDQRHSVGAPTHRTRTSAPDEAQDERAPDPATALEVRGHASDRVATGEARPSTALISGAEHRPPTPSRRALAERARRWGKPARGPGEVDTDVLPLVVTYPSGPISGLAKFDLGTIPASVTPPRSWRHAAWFAVAASILVLVGLAYATVTLVTGPRQPETVDALPGLPSWSWQFTETTSSPPPPPPSHPTAEATRTTTTAPTPSPTSRTVPRPSRTSAAPQQSSATGAPPSTGGTTTTTSTGTNTRPPRSTVSTPTLMAAASDPEAMGDRTEDYFRKVTQDPQAAYAMTSGPMHREGPDSIERRYADVERVEVEEIVIDPGQGTTRSRLRVVREDGTVTTEERELVFTQGDDPKISHDVPAA